MIYLICVIWVKFCLSFFLITILVFYTLNSILNLYKIFTANIVFCILFLNKNDKLFTLYMGPWGLNERRNKNRYIRFEFKCA